MAKQSPYINPDGSFKGGFDGCVAHFTKIEGMSEESARRLCAYIGRRTGKIPAAAADDGPPVLAQAVPVDLQDAQAPEWIMYMPAGAHRIRASLGDQPVELHVDISPDTARVLQHALQQHLAAGAKPYLDFDHAEGAASAWIREFAWRQDPRPGVYARVEWSDAGREAVAGRVYRAFSPAFFVDDIQAGGDRPAMVVGAPVCMGGLVNQPAFRAIAPLWTKNPKQQPMKDPDKKPAPDQELQQLRARLAELEQTAGEAKAKEAQIQALQAKIAELEQTVRAARRRHAEALVAEAVSRGAIPAADEALREKWIKLIEAHDANADLLAKLPGNPALQQRLIASDRPRIVAEDAVRVLQIYAKEKDPAAKAKIWAAEIRPRLKEIDQTPVKAANTLGTLAGELVVQRSLDLLKEEYPQLRLISTDFSDEPVSYGQTVTTRTRSVPAATDYNPDTGYADSDVAAADVGVTIDNHKAVQVKFSANDLAGTVRRLFDEWTEPIHAGLADAVMANVYGLFTPANYTNTTEVAVADFSRSTMTAVAKALNGRGVPKRNRAAFLTPDLFAKLSDDSSIVQLAAYQRPEVITEGVLPRVSGIQPYEAVSFPTANDQLGAAFTPDAVVLAARLPNDYTSVFPGVGDGVVSTIQNPDTGLSVMLVQYIDHKLGAAFMRVALMYGVAVGQAASCQLLVQPAG